jgi:hypothetical protein
MLTTCFDGNESQLLSRLWSNTEKCKKSLRTIYPSRIGHAHPRFRLQEYLILCFDCSSAATLNGGYVLWFNRETRKEIHPLARRDGVKTGPNSELAAKCDICQAANADSTNGPTINPAEGGKRAPDKFSTAKHNKRSVRVKAKGPKPTHSARAGKTGRKS